MVSIKIRFLYIMVLLSICIPIIAEDGNQASRIYTTDSLELILQELPHLDENSLVIFDRDDTLLRGQLAVSKDKNIYDAFMTYWHQLYSENNSPAERSAILALIDNLGPELIDQQAPEIINRLQNAGVKVMVLTGGIHGKSTLGVPVEDLSTAALKKVGIDVSRSFPTLQRTFLETLSHDGTHPLFKDGTLFTNFCPKGDTLEAFFNAIGWYPNHIILVDDNAAYVEAVAETARKFNIPFLGLVYTKAETLPVPNLFLHCLRTSYCKVEKPGH